MRLPTLLYIMLLILALCLPASSNVIYVRANCPGPTYDGTSWDTAFLKVQDGINAAVAGDEVWVTAGTYVERITLKDGVKLYGGFPFDGGTWSDRHPDTSYTIVDAMGGVAITIANCGSSSTLVDGFAIKGNKGSTESLIRCTSSSPTISNCTISGNGGRGVYCANSQVTISNCTITGNAGTQGGGGIACYNGSLIVNGCAISWNSTPEQGGGIYCANSAAKIVGNTIAYNSAAYAGGGVQCGSGSVIVSNNLIKGNYSARGTGGIMCGAQTVVQNCLICANSSGGISWGSGSPLVFGNTVVGNYGGSVSGGASDSVSPVLANNIIAFNSSGIFKAFADSALILKHNCVYGNSEGNYSGIDPGATDVQLDPRFVSVKYGDFHIQQDSPCINAGDNSFANAEQVDMDGQLRILPIDGAVDIGADESDGTNWPTIDRIFYVSESGSDGNNGTSWNSSKKTLQAAIDAATPQGGDVWVAKGTYSGPVTVPPYVYLYGGFAGTESDRSNRDAEHNATTIDGGKSGPCVTLWSSGHLLCTVDGFTITNGQATYGAGIYSPNGSPIISHNIICANSAPGVYGSGGGIYTAGDAEISDNTMTSNTSGKCGAAIYCVSGNLSGDPSIISGYPSINNNVFIDNSCSTVYSGEGGVVFCAKGARSITSNLLTGNVVGHPLTNSPGGTVNSVITCGLTRRDSVVPHIEDNVITDNVGSGLSCSAKSATVFRNTISRNSVSGIVCANSGALVSRNAISDNGSTGISISCSSGSPTITSITQNLIARNRGTQGGGISCTSTTTGVISGTVVISGNTIVGNSDPNYGGGIFLKMFSSMSSIYVANNIIAYNQSGILGLSMGAGPKLINNCVYQNTSFDYRYLSADPTDISLDPLFVDKSKGDYHLLPGSPCIDAGDPTNATNIDLDGNRRPKDGDGDGTAKFDIGCYEAPANYKTIASAKALADGSPVGITCPISTAILPDRFYVESANRIIGLGILGGVSSVGKQVTIEGTMTTINGERLIQPSLVTENSAAPVPAPSFVNCNSLGGGPSGLQSGVSDWRLIKKTNDQGQTYWERDRFTYGGASNIGLLVKMTGRVTNSGQGFFYLDGTAAFDEGVESIKGIRVDWPFAAQPPADGTFIEILGISSCRIVNDTEHGDVVVRLLRPVAPDSYRVMSPVGNRSAAQHAPH